MAYDAIPLTGAYGEPCATRAEVEASRALWRADQQELQDRDDRWDALGIGDGQIGGRFDL